MQELALRSAVELAAQVRERKVSSRELLELYLSRIERLNGPINAVVTLAADAARARARQLDDELVRSGPRGPLHGLPMTIKDAYETAGIRSTGGAGDYAQHVPARNAVAVQRLIDAGAVVFGKTNVPAYSADMQSYNDIFGVTRNPYDLARTPGGSSGGAAAALACGFTALELGSDIGGSIRTPANWTGVFGHKPSYGLVPQRGHIPGPPGTCSEADLVCCGPLARSAADLALSLDVIAGPEGDRAKAWRLALPAPRAQALSQYRIAVWLDDAAFPVDHAVLQVLDRAASALEKAGARLDRNARPDMTLAEIADNYTRLLNPILVSGMPQAVIEALREHVAAARGQEQPDAFTRFAARSTASHIDWLRAHERRTRYNARWAEFFTRFDVLLCPVSGLAAIEHQHEGTPVTRTLRVNEMERPYLDLLGWISMATAHGLPASVVPVGRTASGLPVGMQVIGPALEDRTPIDVAARIAEVAGGFAPPPGF
jgi:amidase